MSWVVLAGAAEVRRARTVAGELGVPMAETPPAEADGVVFLGDDHGLARLAATTPSALPILFVPAGRSDLGRMFRFDQASPAQRLSRGSAYPADLGWATTGDARHPFVAHVVASRTGRLPRPWSRRRSVHVQRRGRATSHDAAAILIANAQHIAGRTVAPRAAIMDGHLEYQAIGGSPAERLSARRSMRRGLPAASGVVHRRPFESLDLQLPSGWRLATDGETLQGASWSVTVAPHAFTLWV